MADRPQTTPPAGFTFGEINDIAWQLHHGFPTPLPALSDIEAAALIGSLKALWLTEVKEPANAN